jgi:four helix bundle protein
MAFHAYEVAIELCRALRKPVALLRTRNRSLADQLQRAATSIPLNVAEGRARSGRDRTQHYRIALGSTAEVGAALDVALAWGLLDEAATRAPLVLADREKAILWGLIDP